jgi:DNA-binding MarR family transcriptional regulator
MQAIEQLVRQIYGLGVVRREIARHALAELGSQGFNALAAIWKDGPMRVSDVARELGVDLSVASRQVAALISAGYVEREADERDRRAAVVSLTDAGRKVLGESHRRMVHAFGEALGDWSEDDLERLSDGLARLNNDFATQMEAGRR